MKKRIALVLIAMLSFAGCAKAKPEQPLMVYSFHGENEQLKITNGVIVCSEETDVFSGGDLEVSGDFPSNITSFTTTFYLSSESQDKTIMTNSVIDQTGTCILVGGELGSISGGGGFLASVLDEEKTANLKNNLYFELTTTDSNGEKNVYQLQMLVSEVLIESEN